MIGRNLRRIRFRTTAFPTFLPIAYPIWGTFDEGWSAEPIASGSVLLDSVGNGAYRTQHHRPWRRRPCDESAANEARDRSGSIRLIAWSGRGGGDLKVRGARPWMTCAGGSHVALSGGAHLAGKFSSRFVPIVSDRCLSNAMRSLRTHQRSNG